MFIIDLKYEDADGLVKNNRCYFKMFVDDVKKLNDHFPNGFESFWKEYERKTGFTNGVDVRDETFVEPTEQEKIELGQQILDMFRKMAELSYGTIDKKLNRFQKASGKEFKQFRKSEMYDELMSLLISDTELAIKFFNDVLPKKRIDEMSNRLQSVTRT